MPSGTSVEGIDAYRMLAALGSARMVLALTMPLVVLAALQADTSVGAAVLGVAAMLAISTALGARYLAVVMVAFRLTIGSRSREHEQSVEVIVAPRHPNTPGRIRSRAPSLSEALA